LARVFIVVGALLFIVPLVDSAVSWPANHVVLDSAALSSWAAVLIPGWIWLIVSYGAVFGFDGRRRRPKYKGVLGTHAGTVVAACAAVALAVVIAGFVIGGSKGSVRVLPNSITQVSTLDLNNAEWTTVSSKAAAMWQARFVREDAVLSLFGLVLMTGAYAFPKLGRARARVLSAQH
jgi:hypothetical protein